MLTDYIIIASITTTAALIWRNTLLDHANILKRVENIPFVGGALTCGFCSAVWFSLIAVLFYSPIYERVDELPYIVSITASWFCLSAGVLFLRNLIAILMEGTGVLTHLHRGGHK